MTQDVDDDEEEQEEDGEDDDDQDNADPEFEKFNRYYDPNQDVKKRQQVKRKSRKLDREIVGESGKTCERALPTQINTDTHLF